MSALSALIGKGALVAQSPWPRVAAGEDLWQEAASLLADGKASLLGLWAEGLSVHLALIDDGSGEVGLFSLECPKRHYPSVGAVHAPAIRLERAIRDLFGLGPVGLPDRRPWLDHGRWGVRHPLETPVSDASGGDPYVFLTAQGEGLHQIPVGPVHAGIIEPGHFRFTANGETVVRLEERLGYVHKGIEGLMAGADLVRAAKLAGRVSGDSTVAYSFAFSRAAEVALGISPPPRAVWLRALMAELERIANHFGDIGGVCNDAAFSLMLAHCGVLREKVLRASDRCFGHRMMRDLIVPGGVACDLSDDEGAFLLSLVGSLEKDFAKLVELYDETTSLQDRTVGTGYLSPDLAHRFGCGGFVGRASSRAFDARVKPGYEPYGDLVFDSPMLTEGDVNARVWIRIQEVRQSLSLIHQILRRLPHGPVLVAATNAGERREGAGLVEGFRGDILVWLRIEEDGTVSRCHLRDPSWFQWPLLEAVIKGNIVADFPLCNKSFNCSYSGHDL